MSAFSDWKCGALTDEQFYSLTARENRRDRDLYEEMSDTGSHEYKCDDCIHRHKCVRVSAFLMANVYPYSDGCQNYESEGEANNDD